MFLRVVASVRSHCSVIFCCVHSPQSIHSTMMDTWDVSRPGLVLIVNILMVQQVDILRPKLEDLALLQKCFGASHCGWRGVSRLKSQVGEGREGGRKRVEVLWS